MKFIKLSLVAISMFLLGSCAKESGMRVRTNTFADKKVIPKGFKPGSSFYISAKQQNNPLFNEEVSKKIATLLKDKGFEVKTNQYFADYELIFSFAMEESTHTRDVPVYIPDYGYWYYYNHHFPYGYHYRVAYVPEEYTLFNKILLVEVYKGKKAVWQGIAHSYEQDSDLRDAIDYLLVTVFKHFGKNTQKYVRSKIEEKDKRVQKLREKYFKPINYKE